MNLVTTNGASLSRCSRTSHAAFPGWTTDAFSTASSGSCAQAHHGVICQTAIPLRLVITALFAGDGLASGTRSWMRWRWLTMRICRRTGSVGEHPTQVQSQGPDL